ncbi:MAG: hypothetical protein U0984_18380, partial [Prosthecobacter sp.]|nr:hypothetical protein [Prosthecobacter sp.]
MSEYPYRFNGLIIGDFDKTGSRGSGVVATHPKIILSAAHNMVDVDLSTKAENSTYSLYADYPTARDVRWFGGFSGIEEPSFLDGASVIRDRVMATDYNHWAIKDDQLDKLAQLVNTPSIRTEFQKANIEANNRDFVAFWGYMSFAGDYAPAVLGASTKMKAAATAKLYTGYPSYPNDPANPPTTPRQWRLFETGPLS